VDTPAGTVIRKATKQDLPDIIRIEAASFDFFDRFPVTLFLYYLHKFKDGFFVILDLTGSIVGYAIIAGTNRFGYILSIAVHPDNRNQGFAKVLIMFLESECREKRIPKLRLDVRVDNQSAIELYKKLGLEEVKVKKNFYGDGIDALMMEKTTIG
jgi:ribosomal-protein-alanine N-acetyltransferase